MPELSWLYPPVMDLGFRDHSTSRPLPLPKTSSLRPRLQTIMLGLSASRKYIDREIQVPITLYFFHKLAQYFHTETGTRHSCCNVPTLIFVFSYIHFYHLKNSLITNLHRGIIDWNLWRKTVLLLQMTLAHFSALHVIYFRMLINPLLSFSPRIYLGKFCP